MREVEVSRLTDVIEKDVYKRQGQTNFGLWNEGEEADLETLKTVKSGKDAFFPQSETLYTCVRAGKKLTVEPEELRSRPFVVFGMKACDEKGVAVLDLSLIHI